MRVVLRGVLVAALLFELVKVGFAQYSASFGYYDATYGALGFVVVLLLFFNLASQVTLFGAEIARSNAEVLESGDLREARGLSERLDGWRRRAGLGWLPTLAVPEPRLSVAERVAGVPEVAQPSDGGAAEVQSVEAGRGSRLVVGAGLVALVVATLARRSRGEG